MLTSDDLKGRIVSRVKEVEAVMAEIMPDRAPASVYSLAWDFMNRGGKRVRPFLLLTAIDGFNGDYKRGLEVAGGIEIFHNFTLVHDDIEDGSEMRRGKPCLHIMHGIPMAINAGDGMFAHVFRAIAASKLSEKEKVRVVEMMADAFIGVVDGQGYEIEWIHNNNWQIDEKLYLKMAGGKTGDLMAACARIGAYLGGATEQECEEMRLFGYEIGLAFQIQDDVLNLVGETEKYKKEIGGDIREGKRTLIVIDALGKLDALQKNELMGILSKKENSQEEINRAIQMMKETGSIDYASKYAERLVSTAKKRLKVVKNEKVRDELELLADMFVNRDA